MAAWLAVSGALGILLAGTFICLFSVICHCRNQAKKIAALEQELRVKKSLDDADTLMKIQDDYYLERNRF